MGFRTEFGRKITRAGVKPKPIFQWNYSYYYIYGLVEPLTGQSFFYEFSHFNSDCFSVFLEKFAQEYSDEIHIIQLDNASCHTANKLSIPSNVIFLFQPPYCPELNPIERGGHGWRGTLATVSCPFWQYIKQKLNSWFFTSLEDVKYKVAKILNSLSEDIIHSLTGWQYILDALSL